jgi:hypothetical protein
MDWVVSDPSGYRVPDHEDGSSEEEADVAGTAGAHHDSSSSASATAPSWRAWGFSTLRAAVNQLDTAGVAAYARSTLDVVKRDVAEFTAAVAEDARDLAAVGTDVVTTRVLPELKNTAVGLQDTLEVVGGGLESASSALLANLAAVCVLPACLLVPKARATCCRCCATHSLTR